MANTEIYDDNSIDLQEGAQRIRLRPASMLGSSGIDGARHGVIELIGNACDEKTSGFGTKLEVEYYDDDAISIRDYGRGVPLGWNEKKGKWNYFLVYEELYAGGKYGDMQEKLASLDWENMTADKLPLLISYLFAVGLNGVGAAATQYTSEYFEVTSYRDGLAKTMKYRDGAHILDELIVEESSEPTGTYIKWKPDARVFSNAILTEKWVKSLCEDISYSMGFDVTFKCGGYTTEYKQTTIEERVKKDCGNVIQNKTFVKTIDELGDILVAISDVAVGPGNRGNDFFHNGVRVKGGIHSESVNGAIANFFDKRGKENGIKIASFDYTNLISVIVSSKGNKKSYRGQTKDSIDDIYVYSCIYDNLLSLLDDAWTKGIPWLSNAVESALTNARNRIAVNQLSKDVRDIEKSIKNAQASDKWKTCEAYDRKRAEEVEMFIVEGDSALGAILEARNSIFQAVLPIRGKSLNVWKASIASIIANREIKDIIAILGCGIDLGIDGFETFNINKLKIGKLIILTDADKDGSHIRFLLFLIIYRLFPELLYGGYVYVAETPIRCLKMNDGSTIYCYTEDEYAEVLETKGKNAISSQARFKGLGEVNEDQLAETTLDPSSRRLTQIKLDRNDVDVYDTLEVLFGKSTDRRKRAILGSLISGDYDEMVNSLEDLTNYVNSLELNNLEMEDVMMY